MHLDERVAGHRSVPSRALISDSFENMYCSRMLEAPRPKVSMYSRAWDRLLCIVNDNKDKHKGDRVDVTIHAYTESRGYKQRQLMP